MDIQERKSFISRWLCFVLFFIPVVYLGSIAAVTLHEVVGHGVMTRLLGGSFSGFGILIDAMGWARVDLTALSPLRQAIVLAGGALVTNLLGIVFLLIGIRLKKQFLLSVALITFALTFFCDGLPYFFWDALYRGGIGDASGILGLYPYAWLRILIIILSGAALMTTIVLCNHLLFGRICMFLGSRGRSSRPERIMVALTLLVVQAAAWFSFDWTQLIPVPEIGLWPSVIPAIITLIVLGTDVMLLEREKPPVQPEHPLRFKAAILTAWGSCAVTVAVILLFLQNGFAL